MRRVAQAAAVAMLLAATLAVARIGEHSTTSAQTGPTTTTTQEIRINPLTPRDPTRIPPQEAAAIARLGEVASTQTPDGAHGRAHAAAAEVALSSDDAEHFAGQLAAARDAAAGLATLDAAQAAGYRSASVPGAGVGTHYVKWSLVDQPFDPARPSMLLFDLRPGRTPQLVGLSYWVRSNGPPEGFAGPNDVWHQHAGYCIVNGWIDKENAPASACAGTWLGGSDLWMLHAWVVPRWENRDGLFANINPKLCPPDAGTPDIARCSFFEGG